jgi:multisubunit Na+/H+ antiporter MnhC subunit
MVTRRTQYLLLNLAILTASLIQLLRHKPLVIVIIAAVVFLFAGNLTIFLAGSKQRARNRQRKIDYYRN